MENIRNFCIIAHIDHGKSTLADRLLEFTGTLNERQMEAQVLDNMDLEKEKGITIKSHAIQMNYKLDGKEYILNLIDTPGHVDFSYEVSRSIAACEGALLIVDASQGIEAQTISNLYLALEHDLEIIPVMNKIDLPHAMPEEVTDEIVELVGCRREDVIRASAKEGKGIEEILRAVVERVKPPKGDPKAPLQAMIFDSVFNSFRGIEIYFRVFNGTIRKGQKIKFVNAEKEYYAEEIGILKLDKKPKGAIITNQNDRQMWNFFSLLFSRSHFCCNFGLDVGRYFFSVDEGVCSLKCFLHDIHKLTGLISSPQLVNFKNGHKSFLRYFNISHLTHTLLTLLLLFQQFTLTRNITTITFRQHVFPDSADIFSGHDLLTNGRLYGDLEHLTWDQLL